MQIEIIWARVDGGIRCTRKRRRGILIFSSVSFFFLSFYFLMSNLSAIWRQMPTLLAHLKMHSYVSEICPVLRNNLQIGSVFASISEHLAWLSTLSCLTCKLQLCLYNMLPLHSVVQNSLRLLYQFFRAQFSAFLFHSIFLKDKAFIHTAITVALIQQPCSCIVLRL